MVPTGTSISIHSEPARDRMSGKGGGLAVGEQWDGKQKNRARQAEY